MENESIRHEIVSRNPDIEVRFFMLESNAHFVPPHWHNSLEFIYIIEGTMSTRFENGVECTVGAGEFSVVNPRRIHSVKVSDNRAIVLQVPSEFMEKYIPAHDLLEFSADMHPASAEAAEKLASVKRIFTDMYEVYMAKPDAYLLRFNSLLYELLFTLVKDFSKRLTDRDISIRRKSLSNVRDIMRYIEKHHAEKLAMDGIAQHFGYNPDYLSRFFKKHIGLTVMQYLYEIRLNGIVRDLQETDMRIHEIFERHGCTNYKHTMQLFRERFDCTPGEKRRMLKRNV